MVWIRTIHQISMFPFMRSRLLGNQLMPFGTRMASSRRAATLIVAGGRGEVREEEGEGEEEEGERRRRGRGALPMNKSHDRVFLQESGHPNTTVLCVIPPRPAPCTLGEEEEEEEVKSLTWQIEVMFDSHLRDAVNNGGGGHHFTEPLYLVVTDKSIQTLCGVSCDQ